LQHLLPLFHNSLFLKKQRGGERKKKSCENDAVAPFANSEIGWPFPQSWQKRKKKGEGKRGKGREGKDVVCGGRFSSFFLEKGGGRGKRKKEGRESGFVMRIIIREKRGKKKKIRITTRLGKRICIFRINGKKKRERTERKGLAGNYYRGRKKKKKEKKKRKGKKKEGGKGENTDSAREFSKGAKTPPVFLPRVRDWNSRVFRREGRKKRERGVKRGGRRKKTWRAKPSSYCFRQGRNRCGSYCGPSKKGKKRGGRKGRGGGKEDNHRCRTRLLFLPSARPLREERGKKKGGKGEGKKEERTREDDQMHGTAEPDCAFHARKRKKKKGGRGGGKGGRKKRNRTILFFDVYISSELSFFQKNKKKGGRKEKTSYAIPGMAGFVRWLSFSLGGKKRRRGKKKGEGKRKKKRNRKNLGKPRGQNACT